MNETIKKLYEDSFYCDTFIEWHEDNQIQPDGEPASGLLEINIDNRSSVEVSNVAKEDAEIIAKELLAKWDFSYFLEFEGYEEYEAFMNM